jgi:kynurenine formamidase
MSERSRDDYPRFDALPVRDDAPLGSSWGVFGDEEQVGTLNFIGPDQVRRAAELVQAGTVFPLNWDIGLPAPAFFKRETVKHTVFEKYPGFAVDDYLDSFWPQASSQWDGLRHIADDENGFYNGATLAEVTVPGPGKLGMEHWATRGIVGRGVLIDVVRWAREEGVRLDAFDFFAIDAALVVEILARRGVELLQGDILVFRTGWVESYEELSQPERDELAAQVRPGSPGLYGADIPPFLWNSRVAAVAADNPALEAGYPSKGSDLSLHRALIARLGMPLGELWDLRALAEDCERDGRSTFFLTSAPLHLPGGVGSPPNVLALK